jgi:putative Mg2+ transporter-C (MgtC) family protein
MSWYSGRMNPADSIGIAHLCLRLGAAVLIGGVLGMNRELHGKPAGVRTHALVTLGAALAATLAVQPFPGDTAPDPDALSRILQGILTGIGFLGAGVILRDKDGHVSGLTTAATVWMCAGLGIVCGLGYWILAGLATAATLGVLLFGRRVERMAARVFKRHPGEPPDVDV